MGLLNASGVATTTPTEPYFSVGPKKLLLMTFATFGLYPLYWFYRNWHAEQANSGRLLSPLMRALFSVIFFYSLAQSLKDRAVSETIPVSYSPALLAVLFVLFTLAGYLPDPLFFLVLGIALPILPIQDVAHKLNAAHGIAPGPEMRFSPINLIGIILVSLLWALAIVGWFLPEP